MTFTLKIFALFFSWALSAELPVLAKLWERELDREEIYPYPELLVGKHVLFVGGLFNELARLTPGYFSDNRDSVEQELGGESSYIGPPSIGSIADNAQFLYEEIVKNHADKKKPLILVGHSKGAAEVLHLILMHPGLILEGLVERVILIQASIGGTPLVNDGGVCFYCEYLQNLGELQTQQVFKEAFDRYEKSIVASKRQAISRRIFYVRSQEDRENHSFCIQIALAFAPGNLDGHGTNDGFLPVSAQIDERIGIDLGVLQADHLGLVLSWIGGVSEKSRKAFTRAMFENVYHHYN